MAVVVAALAGLVALACLGVGIRVGVLWLAVHVSADHQLLGQALLIIGPPGFLVPLIVAMYVCRSSLSRLTELSKVEAEDMPIEKRPARLIDIAASVLIPFLAIYESYGLFDQDIARFRNAAGYAEIGKVLSGGDGDLAGRLGIYSVPAAAGIVGAAWVLRASLGWAERRSGLLSFAYVGALGDVVYTSQVANQAVVLVGRGTRWVQDREAWQWVASAWDTAQLAVGFLAEPLRVVSSVVVGMVDSWDQLILVPIGWLGVGAVVLARKELDEEREAEAAGDGERDAPRRRRDRRPLPARLALALVADVGKRVGALWGALRLLTSAGLYPMLAFSLILLLVVRLPTVVFPLVHVLVGPTDVDTYLAFSPLLDSIQLAVSMAITIPLVAAAVEMLVTARLDRTGLTADLDRRTGGPATGADMVDAPQTDGGTAGATAQATGQATAQATGSST